MGTIRALPARECLESNQSALWVINVGVLIEAGVAVRVVNKIKFAKAGCRKNGKFCRFSGSEAVGEKNIKWCPGPDLNRHDVAVGRF